MALRKKLEAQGLTHENIENVISQFDAKLQQDLQMIDNENFTTMDEEILGTLPVNLYFQQNLT